MSDYANFTMYVDMDSDKALRFRHELKKEESCHFSDYQDIGLIYMRLSSAIRTSPDFVKPAVEYFQSAMRRKGFQEDEIRVLLHAESWEERMRFSWYAVSEQARASSTVVDYNRYQNYWPNLDFCKEGWGKDPYVLITL
ncbi:hypothetical protein [Pseudomonas viridiflava]|uniref:hypothetical protein n=1 Tax=Pseudomonas viridiflava TaxID=33069 RepID=UPI000EFA7B67|nr:hypothetical protein [Pseudomonas viridiflava]